MDNETAQALSNITIALIAGGSALISAIVSTVLAPFVHHFIDGKNRKLEYKIKLITDTRKFLDRSPTLADVKASSMWGFIHEHLNNEERSRMNEEADIIHTDIGVERYLSPDELRIQPISMMLSRLEKEWKILK